MIDQADFLKTTKKDTKLWARFTKRAAHILLISAFALSVFSIFATTVTGTMLKSLGDRDIAEEYEETISPMGFLHKNLPFCDRVCSMARSSHCSMATQVRVFDLSLLLPAGSAPLDRRRGFDVYRQCPGRGR